MASTKRKAVGQHSVVRNTRSRASEAPSLDLPEFVIVQVGSEGAKKLYQLPKVLLEKHSLFFEAAFRGPWKESAEGKIDMPDCQVGIFELFARFIQTGIIYSDLNETDAQDQQRTRPTAEMALLSEAWKYGLVLQSTSFRDAVIDALVDSCKSGRSLIGLDYDDMPDGRAVQNLMVDQFIYQTPTNTLKQLHDAQALTSLKLLVQIITKMRESKSQPYLRRAPWESNPCQYHDHVAERTACYKIKFLMPGETIVGSPSIAQSAERVLPPTDDDDDSE